MYCIRTWEDLCYSGPDVMLLAYNFGSFGCSTNLNYVVYLNVTAARPKGDRI